MQFQQQSQPNQSIESDEASSLGSSVETNTFSSVKPSKTFFLARWVDGLKQKHLIPQRTSLKTVMAFLVIVLALVGVAAASLLVTTGQDLRQQASGEVYNELTPGAGCSGVPEGSFGCDKQSNRLVCGGGSWRTTGQKCTTKTETEDKGGTEAKPESESLKDTTISCFEYEPSSGDCIQRGPKTREECQSSYVFGGDLDQCRAWMAESPTLNASQVANAYGSQECFGGGAPGSCADRDPSQNGVLVQICKKGAWSPPTGDECASVRAALEPKPGIKDPVAPISVPQQSAGSCVGYRGGVVVHGSCDARPVNLQVCRNGVFYNPAEGECNIAPATVQVATAQQQTGAGSNAGTGGIPAQTNAETNPTEITAQNSNGTTVEPNVQSAICTRPNECLGGLTCLSFDIGGTPSGGSCSTSTADAAGLANTNDFASCNEKNIATCNKLDNLEQGVDWECKINAVTQNASCERVDVSSSNEPFSEEVTESENFNIEVTEQSSQIVQGACNFFGVFGLNVCDEEQLSSDSLVPPAVETQGRDCAVPHGQFACLTTSNCARCIDGAWSQNQNQSFCFGVGNCGTEPAEESNNVLTLGDVISRGVSSIIGVINNLPANINLSVGVGNEETQVSSYDPTVAGFSQTGPSRDGEIQRIGCGPTNIVNALLRMGYDTLPDGRPITPENLVDYYYGSNEIGEYGDFYGTGGITLEGMVSILEDNGVETVELFGRDETGSYISLQDYEPNENGGEKEQNLQLIVDELEAGNQVIISGVFYVNGVRHVHYTTLTGYENGNFIGYDTAISLDSSNGYNQSDTAVQINYSELDTSIIREAVVIRPVEGNI